jgi:hypothetical protein
MIMDYLHTYPCSPTAFYASDMILKITSDAAYLVQPKARSRAAAHYHLGWHNSNRLNGAVDVPCKTIKKRRFLCRRGRDWQSTWADNMLVRQELLLEELGHPQPASGTPFETDNNTAQGILNQDETETIKIL